MASSLSLEDAESYLSSTAAQHSHTLTTLAAMRERFTGVLDEKDNACQALTKKHKKSLQTVKLVSAQMIQQREEQIMALLQQVEQLKGPSAGASS